MIDAGKLKNVFDRGEVLMGDMPLLAEVCKMVYLCHFQYAEGFRDDLMQEGQAALVDLVARGLYDPAKGSVLTFAYTRVRNSMSNFMWHENKRNGTEVLDVPEAALYSYMGDLSVSLDDVGEIYRCVRDALSALAGTGLVADCAMSYFKAKLGMAQAVPMPMAVEAGFTDRYRHCVGHVEYVLLERYRGHVFESRLPDMLDMLEGGGHITHELRLFLESVGEGQAARLLYVFAGGAFKLPPLQTLIKADSSLALYRQAELRGVPLPKAARLRGMKAQAAEAMVRECARVLGA